MWKFYYDEAFHDRSITAKEEINIYKENSSDIYTGFFCGYQDVKEMEIFGKYAKFENKYKEIYTIKSDKELKGTTIKRKNYEFGFASFVDNTINFYTDFFEIFDDDQVVFHIGMFSKTELLITEFFKNITFTPPFCFHEESFIYSLIKFLYNYRNQGLLIRMMQIQNQDDVYKVLTELRDLMLNVLAKIEGSKKKEPERNAIKEVLCILGYGKVSDFQAPQLKWRYEPVFKGFNKLLYERKINQNKVDLLIDRENRTYDAALNSSNYFKCHMGESNENMGLRISDMFAHFFGELAVALEKELREAEIKKEQDLDKYEYEQKILLSTRWFTVTEKQFWLWKKIGKIFCEYQMYEWTGYDGTFCDYPVLTFALIEYNLQYETYQKFVEVKPEEHAEYFNTYCCAKLTGIYVRGGSKPAIYR